MWLYDPLPVWHAYRVAFFTLFALALGSCTPVDIHPVASNCLPIVTYSPEFQQQFAAELGELHASNHYPHVETFIVDAERTRDGLRACR